MAHSANLPAPTFDIDSWISNYQGPLLPYRCRHIALNCPALAQQALAYGIQSAKSDNDISSYEALAEFATTLGLNINVDSEWIARQKDGNKRELSRLETELRGYKNNLIRESIRMGQEDLATFLLKTGGTPKPPDAVDVPASQQPHGLASAYAAFGKMRDYCTTPAHVAGMTIRLLFTAIVQAVQAGQTGSSVTTHFNSALAQASRLLTTGVKPEEELKLKPISHAARGIALLGQSDYLEAAHAFAKVDLSLNNSEAVQGINFCSTCATANDIAIYGGLTALATMSREELEITVLSGDFRPFLELEPHLRKAMTLYTTGKYRAALDILWRYYSDWSLDIFLGHGHGTAEGSHVDKLFARIREKSITAYFGSFSQVSLASLLNTFPPRNQSNAMQQLEAELVAMIEDGTLNARIDIVNGTLLAPQQDRRSSVQADALSTADTIERTLTQRLHKINITLARLELPMQRRDATSDWTQMMST